MLLPHSKTRSDASIPYPSFLPVVLVQSRESNKSSATIGLSRAAAIFPTQLRESDI